MPLSTLLWRGISDPLKVLVLGVLLAAGWYALWWSLGKAYDSDAAVEALGSIGDAMGPRWLVDQVNRWGDWESGLRQDYTLPWPPLPASDDALVAWFQEQPDVRIRFIERHYSPQELKIGIVRKQTFAALEPPLKQLGYSDEGKLRTRLFDIQLVYPERRPFLAWCLGSMQLALLGVAGWRIRRMAQRGEARLPLGGWPGVKAMLIALLLGLVVAGVWWGQERILDRVAEPSPYFPGGPWWSLMLIPSQWRMLGLGLGILVAVPIQELFFRGALFGPFAAARHAWIGAVLSAFWFALFRLELRAMPGAFVVGLLLAGAYVWSHSLLVPMTANALGSFLSLALLLCPPLGLPAEDAVIGSWRNAGGMVVVFSTDGTVDDGQRGGASTFRFSDARNVIVQAREPLFGTTMEMRLEIEATPERLTLRHVNGQSQHFERLP